MVNLIVGVDKFERLFMIIGRKSLQQEPGVHSRVA